MAIPVATKPPTPAQRTAAALQRAAKFLAAENEKLLAVALTEVAVEVVLTNQAFAERVRERYDELNAKPVRAAQPRQPRSVRTDTAPKPKLAPGRTPGSHVDIVSPIDPRTLVPLYGANLPAHLAEFSRTALWQMARVLAGQTGTKAPPKSSTADVFIAYIMRYVSS
ncbi:MAG TPA: hypothetical protein VGF38_24145 [Ktedonobacterales bacterium]|jgi:hypothetical protein